MINTVHATDFLIGHTIIPDGTVHCCVTSPPYWALRNYGDKVISEFPEITFSLFGMPVTVPAWTGQLGQEPNPMMHVAHIVHVFRQVWRVLRKDGISRKLGRDYIAFEINPDYAPIYEKYTHNQLGLFK
jgi:DNA modification methylase